MLDLYLCCSVRSEGNKILHITPADAYNPPSHIGQIVLTGESLTGILAYFLLGVSEPLAAVEFDDDLETRESDAPGIDVVFDHDRESGNDVTRIQTFDNPRHHDLENVIASAVRCFDECLGTRETMVVGET